MTGNFVAVEEAGLGTRKREERQQDKAGQGRAGRSGAKQRHTMLKAVLSTSLVSGGKLPASSDTVAPSRAAFCVVQYIGISRILPRQYAVAINLLKQCAQAHEDSDDTYSRQSSSAPSISCPHPTLSARRVSARSGKRQNITDTLGYS